MLTIPNLSFLTMPWVLVGGIAIRAYAPERMTIDIDILIAANDSRSAQQAFINAGYTLTATLSIGGFTMELPANPPIDVLTSTAPWVTQALTNPTYDAAGYPVIPRSYLVLMKLESGRSIDMGDLSRLIGSANQTERQDMRAIVGRYRPEFVEDYDALVALADLEFGEPPA
ncbi:MAG: hypothetical protein Fur005_20240 [Roseiflexaceae bacterium]